MNILDTVIKRLDSFSLLETDWDQDGAEIIDTNVINTAKEFLKALYSQKELLYHPEVDPCCNGTIDILWHTDNHQLLINIKKDCKTIGYYGENKKNNTSIKDTIAISDIHQNLLPWMKWIYA